MDFVSDNFLILLYLPIVFYALGLGIIVLTAIISKVVNVIMANDLMGDEAVRTANTKREWHLRALLLGSAFGGVFLFYWY